MDQHERPYQCPRKESQKLKRYTTPIGLTRHDRGVHKKRESLYFCPFTVCKRNKKPFTRKAYLENHLKKRYNQINCCETKQLVKAEIHKEDQSLCCPFTECNRNTKPFDRQHKLDYHLENLYVEINSCETKLELGVFGLSKDDNAKNGSRKIDGKVEKRSYGAGTKYLSEYMQTRNMDHKIIQKILNPAQALSFAPRRD